MSMMQSRLKLSNLFYRNFASYYAKYKKTDTFSKKHRILITKKHSLVVCLIIPRSMDRVMLIRSRYILRRPCRPVISAADVGWPAPSTVVTGPYRGEYRYIPHIIAAEFSAKVPSSHHHITWRKRKQASKASVSEK